MLLIAMPDRMLLKARRLKRSVQKDRKNSGGDGVFPSDRLMIDAFGSPEELRIKFYGYRGIRYDDKKQTME